MLTVTGLTRIFANRYDAIAGGVRDAAFTLAPGAFFTLLGPSGCGKTTTLRCLAGLERPDGGRIELDGQVIFDAASGVVVPVHRRGIGMVFQSYAIWPHMTVFENVAFPLRVARERVAREALAAKVERALATVGLAGYGERPATRLSGGQQQRVALARAIVHAPKLLLLDEPLSNLDAALREEMRDELRRLQQEIGVTTVYVTHDQSEALAMSDLVAVMDRGRIVQLDAPRAIYFTPASEFVARFIGAANMLRGTAAAAVAAGAIGAVQLAGGGRIAAHFAAGAAAGAAVQVAVRPESITLAAADGAGPAGGNALPAVLRAVSFLGATVRCDADAAGRMVRVAAPAGPVPAVGAAVSLHFAAQSAIALAT
ncbi:MAG: ABC transporter ATP-binding protein [Acetobacteraceae bacterium]|nr:ABC transporter ATP-binding protein [Acetobacteraceae bacterium]